ncbi:ubiquitin-protein transferase [Aureococcus anophagefferens]|uniref:Ubiquitin-protein transferase n=1 Tax=Aureococcus anophagefferens TaxID=44056 RepID=A0ABR1FXP8_AURAN
MVALSFLVVVAVASSDDAPFDAALAAEGARGLAAARTAREGSGPRSLDALGVALRVGCELRVLDGNATLELRAGRRRRRFDVAAPCAGPWPACGRGAPATPLLCARVSRCGPGRGAARRAAGAPTPGSRERRVGRPFLETFARGALGGEVALPAPCYRQFFGAAVLLATATPWAVGFLARWFRLRSAP